jgi:hypothetical protein
MTLAKWNRRPKRSHLKTKEDELPVKIGAEPSFKVTRLRTKTKKRKHPGFTIIPKHRHWIFDGNKVNGG